MPPTKRIQVLLAIVTLLGAATYVIRSLYFAHSALSIGDEGAYLYKGLAFARGEYRPFEDFGYWTNKAPLAFLIPGTVQLWFGAGLREARYFALAVSFFMLAGVWIVTRRLGGKTWAAVAVWVFAFSNANVSIYSQALSQGLVACMLTWMLVCILDENRPRWQVIAGSVISVLIVMTRQNMIVLLPLFMLYIFWAHGRGAGLTALITTGTVFIGFHVLYWPNILQLWAEWLPESITPYLNDFRPFATFGYEAWDVENLSRIQSVAIGVQHHFFILCGFVCALALFPARGDWKSQFKFKSAVFLGLAFLALFIMHTWASLFNQFCTQCFSPYLMFYTVAGLLFVVIVFSNGVKVTHVRATLVAVILVSFAAGFGSYYFQRLGTWSLDAIQIPRLGRLFAGDGLVWATLGNVFTYVFNLPLDAQKRLGAAIIGALVGLIGLIALLIIRWFVKPKTGMDGHASLAAINLFLAIGVILPPALNTEQYSSPCSTNFLAYYEDAAASLAAAIPPGSQVYWKGSGRHLALLLYQDDIRVFPPQITAGAGYVLAGDNDRLLKFGLFNDAVDLEWRESADFFIIWDGYPNIELADFQNDGRYEAIPFEMDALDRCEDPLYLFRRRS